MKKTLYITICLLVFIDIFVFGAVSCLAHQPRIVGTDERIVVDSPEVSKAYYGELVGASVKYIIEADKLFQLYVNILVPDVSRAKNDFSVEITKDGKIVEVLNGQMAKWTTFHEEFADDDYYKGPEYDKKAEAGRYELRVFSPANQGKYVLAIGKEEKIPISEMIKTIVALPKLKKDYFEKSPWDAYFNRIGLYMLMGIILVVVVIAALIFVIKKLKGLKQPPHINTA